MQLNKKIMNIHEIQMLLIGFGAKLAIPMAEKGSPNKSF